MAFPAGMPTTSSTLRQDASVGAGVGRGVGDGVGAGVGCGDVGAGLGGDVWLAEASTSSFVRNPHPPTKAARTARTTIRITASNLFDDVRIASYNTVWWRAVVTSRVPAYSLSRLTILGAKNSQFCTSNVAILHFRPCFVRLLRSVLAGRIECNPPNGGFSAVIRNGREQRRPLVQSNLDGIEQASVRRRRGIPQTCQLHDLTQFNLRKMTRCSLGRMIVHRCWCRTISPVDRYTTSSAMLVAWSAMRSRFLAIDRMSR